MTWGQHVTGMGTITTFRHHVVDLDNPSVESVDVFDIAQGLSNLCRFGGQIKQFYSVAEHACLVHDLAWEAGASRDQLLACLHHDSHEAYLGDIQSPAKYLMGIAYRGAAWKWDTVIAKAFKFHQSEFKAGALKELDKLALRIEGCKLNGGPGWTEPVKPPKSVVWHGGLLPHVAREWFLTRHTALTQ